MGNQSTHQNENPDEIPEDLESTSFDSIRCNIDLQNWMGKLPEHLTKVPIIHLSIPGSHNSFSYSLSPSLGVSPDSPPLVRNVGKCCRLLTNRIIYNWSKGQKQHVVRQLILGIRYFDVRLVVKDNDIFISHGLYGGKIDEFLEEMNTFLVSHPKEVVILDFQHFYEFRPEHHDRMICMLSNVFGTKICKKKQKMSENTLKKFWHAMHQVLIIYRNQVTRSKDILWPSGTWLTPWPNKIKVQELLEYLSESLTTRKEGMGFVSQGILTPDSKYVARHFFSSLNNLAAKTNKKVICWLETKSNGPRGVNVVICDFIEKYDFCKEVVMLNYKDGNESTRKI